MRSVMIVGIVVAVLLAIKANGNGNGDMKSLARAEASSGADLVGIGNCRVVNLLEAVKLHDSKIVYGTIRDDRGEHRHLWTLDSSDRIIDRSCPPGRSECRDRGYRAIVRTRDMRVLWTAPGDTSWQISHAYASEFVATVRAKQGRI